MKVIRNGVFETNSSSSHSLSIKRNTKGVYDYYLPLNVQGKYSLVFGGNYDFGWGLNSYNTLEAKVNYLACMAFQTHVKLLQRNNRRALYDVRQVLTIPDIKKISKALEKCVPNFTGFLVSKKYFGYSEYRVYKELYLYNEIDHQSVDGYKNIDDFLNEYKITLENFLFNPKIKLMIANDNM